MNLFTNSLPGANQSAPGSINQLIDRSGEMQAAYLSENMERRSNWSLRRVQWEDG